MPLAATNNNDHNNDYNDYNELEVTVSPDDVVVDMDLDQFEGAEPDMGADEWNH